MQTGRWAGVCIVILMAYGLAGCRKDGQMDRPPEDPHSAQEARRQQATVRDVAMDIQRAPDAAAEAAALGRFREWSANRGYTYVVRTLDPASNAELSNPSGQNRPVRVEVEVYQAERVVDTFSFIARDNRNIGIIAKG